jgi:hypothetical protein
VSLKKNSAAAVEARTRKFSIQNLAEAGREHAGPVCGITGIHTPYAVSVKMSRHWFLALLTVF